MDRGVARVGAKHGAALVASMLRFGMTCGTFPDAHDAFLVLRVSMFATSLFVYKCVCVKHLNRCKTSSTQFFAGGPWAHGWHGPTKTHPCCRENVPAPFQFPKWQPAKPRTGMSFFQRFSNQFFM